MNASAPRLPQVPLTEGAARHFGLAHVARMLGPSAAQLVRRVPEPQDDARWKRHTLDGRSYLIAQPVTFTPYAAVQPCSARCLFCSENLRGTNAGTPASLLRPSEHYFDQLGGALAALRGVPLSYSLSGIETTDDPDFMCAMLDRLDDHARHSEVEQRVLYSNGAGFAGSACARLVARLSAFGLSWVELSRHHFDAEKNQRIMRFRDGQAQRDAGPFDALLASLREAFPVKLVCIVQRGGIDSAATLHQYLDWARARGVRSVIVREFSKLDASYRPNNTARYIDDARVDITQLLAASRTQLGAQLTLHSVTAGYYFWNVIGRYGDMEVVFEVADYAMMRAQHDSRRIYKLVFHMHGVLCAGWDPQQHVLLDLRDRSLTQEASHGA